MAAGQCGRNGIGMRKSNAVLTFSGGCSEGGKMFLPSALFPRRARPVIDRSLLWFGSIDLAGSHHKEEDNVMRELASVIASEMLGYMLGGTKELVEYTQDHED